MIVVFTVSALFFLICGINRITSEGFKSKLFWEGLILAGIIILGLIINKFYG